MTSKLKLKPSDVMVKFLKERVESNQGISLQKLTGHLSQLPQDVRSKYGCSVKSLKSFLQQHPQTFRIHNETNVYVMSGKKSSLRSSLNGSVESIPTSTSDHGGGNSSDGHGESSEDVKSLTNVKGKVYRLFNVFGFISVSYPVKTSVYFDVQAFEDGEYANLSASGLQLGECVILDAKEGPRDCEAKFRASRVCRLENASNETTTQTMPDSVDTTGIVQKVQDKYGFIKFGRNNRERAFFHLNNIHRPPGVNIHTLPDILTVDDKVRFKAKPSKKSTDQVKWEATVVYVPQYSKKGELTPGDSYSDDESGNEVFMSDDESDMVDYLCQKLEENQEDSVAATYDWDRASAEEPQPERRSLSPVHGGDSSQWERLPKRAGEKGRLVPKTETEGEISFGNEIVHVSSDVTYHGGEPVDNLMWEMPDNQEVLFDAVGTGDGLWIATLVWTEARPPAPPVAQSKEVFYRRLQVLRGSGENTSNERVEEGRARQEQPAMKRRSKRKPRVSICSDVKGKVVTVMEHVGYCELEVNGSTRKVMFMSDRFYKDGGPCDDLTDILHVGDEVRLEYMLGVDGRTGKEQFHCDLVWQGPRPSRVAPELTPEQFVQSLNISTTHQDYDDDDDGDDVPRDANRSYDGFEGCEDHHGSLEPLKLVGMQTLKAEEAKDSASFVSGSTRSSRTSQRQVSDSFDPFHESYSAPIQDQPRVARGRAYDMGSAGDGAGVGSALSSNTDISEETLQRLAAALGRELRNLQGVRVVMRDVATQTPALPIERPAATEDGAAVPLAHTGAQTVSTGAIKSEELFVD